MVTASRLAAAGVLITVVAIATILVCCKIDLRGGGISSLGVASMGGLSGYSGGGGCDGGGGGGGGGCA